jgi:hypothetical protein
VRSVAWYGAVTVWLVGLAVCLVAAVFDSEEILVAFPVAMGACAVGVVLCYGFGHFLFRLVPSIAAIVLVVWVLHTAGVPWLSLGLIPGIVVFGLPRLERALDRPGAVGL